MNPFGIFSGLSVLFEVIAGAFGRKRRRETTRDRIAFKVAYSLLWLLCLAAFAVVIWELYFRH
jgi:hypothetical protein